MQTNRVFDLPRRGAGSLILFTILAILITLAANPAYARPSRQASYDDVLRTYIANQMDTYKIPGLAIAIVRDGKVEYIEGFGIADPTGRRVTPETPFLLASVSKGITALAVMQLVEAGLLGLDDPIQEHLPWFEVAGGQGGEITVAQLLYQTSGFTELAGREANLRPDGPDALEEAVRALAAEELAFAPGEGWEYSNLNYDVLGMLVEAVSGQRYGEYIKTNIFAPLEMDTSFASLEEARSSGAARGYYPFFGFPLPFDVLMPYSRATLPSAGLWSTAEDLSRYLLALLDGGRYGNRSVLSEAGVAELQTAGYMFHDTQGYAMGWTVNHNFADPQDLEGTGLEEHAGDTILFHEGDGASFKAVAFLIPELEYGSILLMNTNDPTVASAFRFFGWDVALVALGAQAQYFPPAESFLIRQLRPLAGGFALLMMVGMVWEVKTLRRQGREGTIRPAARNGALVLAVGGVLLAGYIFLKFLPDNGSSLPLVIRFAPDIGLLLVAILICAAGSAAAVVLLLIRSRRVMRP